MAERGLPALAVLEGPRAGDDRNAMKVEDPPRVRILEMRFLTQLKESPPIPAMGLPIPPGLLSETGRRLLMYNSVYNM
jgi:hypothetical protein